MFHISAHKAPGPEGMTGLFFQHYWQIVKADLINMVLQFFHSGRLLKELNHSFIVLLPKKENPTSITDFRPISLSKVAYKFIAKLLVARLRPVLPLLISSSQAAFVLGRSIQENSFIARELFHSMKHKYGHKGIMALKLDMLKAYDRLELGFILKVLRCFGFPRKWIGWIEHCVSTILLLCVAER